MLLKQIAFFAGRKMQWSTCFFVGWSLAFMAIFGISFLSNGSYTFAAPGPGTAGGGSDVGFFFVVLF